MVMLVSKTKGANDFSMRYVAKSILDAATESLAELLAEYESLVHPMVHPIEPLVRSMNVTLTEHAVIVGERVM